MLGARWEKQNLHELIPKVSTQDERFTRMRTRAHTTSRIYPRHTRARTPNCKSLSKVRKQQLLVNLRN